MDILGESPEVTLADVQTGSAPAGITREWMENMVYSSGRKVHISSFVRFFLKKKLRTSKPLFGATDTHVLDFW